MVIEEEGVVARGGRVKKGGGVSVVESGLGCVDFVEGERGEACLIGEKGVLTEV